MDGAEFGDLLNRVGQSLRVDMSETPTFVEFTEQGEEGLVHVVISWYGCDIYETRGGRSHGESDAAEVFG